MATMFQSWSLLIAVAVLAVQLCTGQRSCDIRSTAGSAVQWGSNFTVYCTFNCKCEGSMFCDSPPTQQKHEKFNSTTIYFNVVNITKTRTYSCHCACSPPRDPCGLDISAGYPPDHPKNFKCDYKVITNDSGDLVCTWNRERDTLLWTRSVLRVRTVTGNHTGELHRVSSEGTESLSASFAVSRSVQLLSVWVETQNSLGSVESPTVNYTLSDIAMPPAPVLVQPECSSRECFIKVEEPVRTQHVEIEYTADQQTWTTSPDSVVQMSSSQVRSVSSLEPYRLYHFRARSKFNTGNWSEWSANISSWTQEEAPAEELDVWFTEDFKSRRVYWKEPDVSISRGKIIAYKVSVKSPNSRVVRNISADTRSYSVPFRADCEVTVWACNSKGLSPPARITTRHTKVKHAQEVHVSAGNYSIAISWRKPKTAPLLPAGYVVEWYPEGHQLQELRWLKLDKNDNQTVISGINAFECYEGAVSVFYNDSSVSRTRFKRIATLESAPAVGPLIEEKVKGNDVEITWMELPRGQRRGCISTYSIYLENSSGHRELYSVASPKRTYTIKGLSPGAYNLWMSASTATGGEGPAGNKVTFFVEEETSFSLLLVCGVVSVMALFLVCLCQSSAVKRRFYKFFQCLMLDVVPDPANSKWAKEYIQDKGRMSLMPQQSNSNFSSEEEEPILVDVEELPKQSGDASSPTTISLQLPPQTGLSPETDPATLLYPVTTYIKSFSHDSDSSDQTQTSLDTNSTVDYISSHGPGNMDEEDEEEEEDELVDMHFFPSHNIFMDSLEFGGKLTLDAVKIDCGDFFQNA
ncbi:interleukin-12 receptor subunit beta-2 [Stegastes partitus]|uniref:Interleukin-12 receptor subunit beta-2-like n=1 Tax=Stegastes partitus TaxID=144197 RepID=A0A3B5AYI6_9TELE|nr:PREDICTED: interleukin-12 receptor subunit beta-2-like [Stegastes partitus]